MQNNRCNQASVNMWHQSTSTLTDLH